MRVMLAARQQAAENSTQEAASSSAEPEWSRPWKRKVGAGQVDVPEKGVLDTRADKRPEGDSCILIRLRREGMKSGEEKGSRLKYLLPPLVLRRKQAGNQR